MGRQIYYCNECKKLIAKIEDVYFIESGFNRNFCSEDCIFRFFTPLMLHFEEQENVFRNRQGLSQDVNLTQEKFQGLIKSTLEDPDEIWSGPRDMGEEIYTLISKVEMIENCTLYVIILAYAFDSRPSLTLLATITKYDQLVDKYRIGQQVGHFREFEYQQNALSYDPQDPNPLNLSEATMEILDEKKTQLYELLVSTRKDDDIDMSDFEQYTTYLPITLEDPDEVFHELKDDIPEFVTYFKNYQDNEQNFFYIVVCFYCIGESDDLEDTLIPIFSFPSHDGNIYKTFQIGERINGPSLN